MNSQNEAKLHKKITAACETALSTTGHVTPVDALLATGWLTADNLTRWQRGHVAYLERVVTASLPKINTAMRLFRRWTQQRGLRSSQITYTTSTRPHRPLRFSKSGAPAIERIYRTRWS
jgi:hypothetical protein